MKSKKNIQFFKIFFISTFLLSILSIFTYYYINNTYNNLVLNFYNKFDNKNFEGAKDLLSDKSIVIKAKNKSLNNDLNIYFTSLINKLCVDIKNGKIMPLQATNILKEIKEYNVVDNSIDKLILSLDENYVPADINSSESILDLAVSELEGKNYSKAIELLNNVPSTDLSLYAKAKAYITKCKSEYKTTLFKDADELVANKYYSKAIALLSNIDTSIISNDDIDLQNKINSIQNFKSEYLATGFLSDSEYTSSAILESITMDNINSLNIESKTEYFLYVNLTEQKTYIYRGSNNDWNLYKSFYCSTGISGEETPKGIFSVSDRGDWFYSDDYDQGGKYWVRFMGEYLFHSLPFNEDASKVVDDTLGKPASHGCIRLNIEDAKWIYDNVLDDTKVIIN